MRHRTSGLFDEARIARRRLRKWAFVVAAVLVLAYVGAEVAPVLRHPDLALFDLWQSIRGTDRPSPQVVIVAIDERSIDRFGPHPWPRNEYVPLIERLRAAGARVIGFDFTFGGLGRETANNQLLAVAMQKAGNVVFGYEFVDVGDPSPAGTLPSSVVEAQSLSTFESPAIPNAPGLIEPEAVLAAEAAALGHVTTVASEDGRIRVVPLFVQHGERAYPSLALQIARIYTRTPWERIALENGVVHLGSRDIPVSASGELLMNWPAAGEDAFVRYPFVDVVRGDVPAEAFRGKAVLVAGTASGDDDRDFPFAIEAPGVLLYATFLDNVFRADFVQAPSWLFLLEWGLFLAACGLGVWLLPRLSTPALLIGVPALVLVGLGAAAFVFVQQGVWIKVFFPVFSLVALLASTVTLRLTASERETRDAAAEKAESQKLLGLSFQEKGMLDMALATFDKLPFTDDIKQVYFNLALDFENRGQREKAFLVYKKIFDADPAFPDVAVRMERLSQVSTGSHLVAQPSLPASVEESQAITQLHDSAPSVPPPSSPGTPQSFASAPESGQFRSVAPGVPIATASPGGPFLPGSRFARYEIEKHLGRGGMGDVYLVKDTVLGRRAALKTIRPDTSLDARQVIEMRQRFYREAQTAGKLAHPNIVTVYDVGEEQGMSYIVMEYVDGKTLSVLMEKHRLSLPQIKHIIYGAAVGLDHAHQHGVFHRDVKPDNVMVSKTDAVKVMDFGIARIVDSDLTRTGSVMGTPHYMSPEQFSGKKIDARADIFSLGVILYQLLTGNLPFQGETVHALMFAILQSEPPDPSKIAKLPPVWDEIVRKALAKSPEGRYSTALEFGNAVMAAPPG